MRWSYEAKSCKEELTGCFETLSGDGDPSFGVNRTVQEGPAWPPAWFRTAAEGREWRPVISLSVLEASFLFLIGPDVVRAHEPLGAG